MSFAANAVLLLCGGRAEQGGGGSTKGRKRIEKKGSKVRSQSNLCQCCEKNDMEWPPRMTMSGENKHQNFYVTSLLPLVSSVRTCQTWIMYTPLFLKINAFVNGYYTPSYPTGLTSATNSALNMSQWNILLECHINVTTFFFVNLLRL